MHCHVYCDYCDAYLDATEDKNEPETAAIVPGSGGENEMNSSLPSNYNTTGGENQVKKINLGDYARVYDKAMHNKATDESLQIVMVPNILHELHKMASSAELPSWMFNEIKSSFFAKWDAIEIEVKDDA